jgi:hypothetical protein
MKKYVIEMLKIFWGYEEIRKNMHVVNLCVLVRRLAGQVICIFYMISKRNRRHKATVLFCM